MSQCTILYSTNNPAIEKNQASVKPKYQRKAQLPIKIFYKGGETMSSQVFMEEVDPKSLAADNRFIPMDKINKIQQISDDAFKNREFRPSTKLFETVQ
jgi:hypothetical protein